MSAAGVAIGVAAAVAAGPLLRGLVFGIGTSDPATLAAAADPAETLRDGA